MKLFRNIFKSKKPTIHQHDFKIRYRTGNPENGQSDVCKCECGQWAVRHYGKDYKLIDN